MRTHQAASGPLDGTARYIRQFTGRVPAEDMRQAREVLLGLLTGQAGNWIAEQLVDGLVQLAPTAEDKRQAREVLLGLLTSQDKDFIAERLMRRVALLDPTVRDLSTWHAWAIPLTVELLAAVRRNSDLADWLAALPSLSSLSG